MNPKAVTPAPFAEPLAWPLSPGWVSYFQGLFAGAQPQGGSTANRPIAPALYQYYFDTTLGIPIFCNQVSPTVAWCDATGVSV